MNQKQSKKERKNKTQDFTKMPKDKASITSNIIIGVIIAAFLGLGGYAVGTKYMENKANAPAENAEQTQAQTVKTAAESEGITTAEYLEKYGLDSSLSEDTSITDAYSMMTVENMAKANGKDTDTFRQENFVPEEITNDTPWGEVVPELPFKALVGEEQVEQFKSVYGLGDDITADTKWKDVEPILTQKQAELQAAMDNAETAEGETATQDTENDDNASSENNDAE